MIHSGDLDSAPFSVDFGLEFYSTLILSPLQRAAANIGSSLPSGCCTLSDSAGSGPLHKHESPKLGVTFAVDNQALSPLQSLSPRTSP